MILRTMEALHYSKWIFTWLCICPDNNDTIIYLIRIIVNIIIISTEFLALVASILFMLFNLSVDLKNSLYALFQVAALFCVLYMWVIGYNMRNRVAKIFSKYQKIIDKSNFFLNFNKISHIENVCNLRLNFAFQFNR